MTYGNIEGFEVSIVLENLSKRATKLFWQSVRLRDASTNVRVIRGASLTPTEKSQLSLAFSELNRCDLMKRVRREYYMLNPKAVLPLFDCYETVQDKWNKLP